MIFRMGPNMNPDVRVLKEHGIKPSAQRLAVAEYVLHTLEHPSAEKVWGRVRERLPMISRATIYNTLNLFVEQGLLQPLHLASDSVLFDANTDRHHHFIDVESGRIYDVPWNQIEVRNLQPPPGFEVHAYQAVLRGCRRQPPR